MNNGKGNGDSDTFYDTHMHAYNLSHPSLGAMGLRFIRHLTGKDRIGNKWMKQIMIKALYSAKHGNGLLFYIVVAVLLAIPVFYLGVVMIAWQMAGKPEGMSYYVFLVMAALPVAILLVWSRLGIRHILSEVGNFINLLFVMDYSLDEYFQALEDELAKDNNIHLRGKTYKKFAVAPMMMDFSGEHEHVSDAFDKMEKEKRLFIDKPYYLPKNKSFDYQEFDLLKGINGYYEKKGSPEEALLEFYPFRGIEFHEDMAMGELKRILITHFCDLPMDPAKRKTAISDGIKDFPMNATLIRETLKGRRGKSKTYHIYAGFKVYPPLGFDPWPEVSPGMTVDEKKKTREQKDMLELFYKTCQKLKIPILTHCGTSDAGTVDNETYKLLTHPKRWEKVLCHYPDLKVCFAHFGNGKSFKDIDEWIQKIVEFMCTEEYKGVYVDLGARCHTMKDYDELVNMIENLSDVNKLDQDKIYDRILFGTDFPMTCFNTDSYSGYINVFSDIEESVLPDSVKSKFCESNPQRFLFGDNVI